MNKLTQVSEETFENEVLKSETPVLVDFYADWCGPCKVISPILEEIAEEADSGFRVVKVDVDENGLVAANYSVQSIPTLILFKDGEPVERWVGVVPKGLILDRARNHMSVVQTVER